MPADRTDYMRAYSEQYRSVNREKLRARKKAWYLANRERELEKMRQRAADNREDNAAKQRIYAKANLAYVALHKKADRHWRKQAAPPWLTAEHWAEMNQIYSDAHAAGLTVDHLWTIKGKNWCGLHVPWNLHAMTKLENNQKKDMPADEWLRIWPKSPLYDATFAEAYWAARKHGAKLQHREKVKAYYQANREARLAYARQYATKRKEPPPCT